MIRYCVIALSLMALPAYADDIVRTISVQGEAKQMTAPDQAHIHFTLESKGRTIEDVKVAQDHKLRKLFQIVGELQIEKKHLKTQYAQIHPQYRYNEGKQLFDGYRASTTIDITIEELEKVAPALEKFVKAGFERINNVRYVIKDDQPIREKLQIEALQNAKMKAEKMAAAMNMSVGKPIQISESGYQPPIMRPMMRGAVMESMALGSAQADAALPAGEQETRVNMHVSFELIEDE